MGRIGTASVLSLVVAASAVTTALVYRPGRSGSGEKPVRPTSWEEWYALSEADRTTWIELYRTISRRPDSEEVWGRARRFAGLPDGEKQRLGALYAVLREVLEGLPAPRRAALRSLPETARADAVYKILETEMPGRLAELRGRPGSKP
jgi:hypothetical protein